MHGQGACLSCAAGHPEGGGEPWCRALFGGLEAFDQLAQAEGRAGDDR